ncbi:unnamed protein product [Clonostachys rosea f. rosea IK726]|uniref:Zn(2)-C6 fungal-type domain-containing protein n=2 Tax=Bionectria ochroleuca TaxID=29856 RepID=A0A0B7KMD4_BIOOC|nr:unnamed protein product [Clonostachys rosea f. rosea IK726]
MATASNLGTATRFRRITRACDFCHRRGLKCRAAAESIAIGGTQPCLTCAEYRQECTWNRQPKKRGTKSRIATQAQQQDDASVRAGNGPFKILDPPAVRVIANSSIGSRKIITALLDAYLDSIHPIFPFFCEREIWVGWRDGTFPADASDYMSLMCMCALSAQHVGSGALFSDDVPTVESSLLAQDYLAEAVRLVPLDFKGPCINQIRSYGYLSLLGAQTGNYGMAHKYLGLYHGMCAHYNLHDESQWPAGLSECEIEVRRRLWWIMYRLEVHTACVHGSVVRCSEAQCFVGYPSGLHHPPFIPGRDGKYEDWFRGWNATTDLYRVLEHVITDFRSRRRPQSSILGASHAKAPAVSVNEKLTKIQEEILPHFGSASSRSSDSGRNRCGFQASNILCTIYLARMISISGESNFHSACQTAHDMVASVSTIPIEYIRAIGSPLLQQLAGVGHMLAGVASKHQFSHADREQFRLVLTSMIQFLSQLKAHNSTAATEELRLTAHLSEADRNWSLANAGTQVLDDGATYDNLAWPDHLQNLVEEMSDDRLFFSMHLERSLAWPFEPRDEDGPEP